MSSVCIIAPAQQGALFSAKLTRQIMIPSGSTVIPGPAEKPGRGQPGHMKHFRRCRICHKFFSSHKMVTIHKRLAHGIEDGSGSDDGPGRGTTK